MLTRLIWLLLCVLHAFVAALLGRVAWQAATTKHWPTTQGTVVAFYQTPNYRYSTGGRSYTNACVSCNEFFSTSRAIRDSAKYAVRYPLQAKVLVHYCPEDPTLAVLETEFDASVLWLVAVLLGVACLCAAGFLFGWRMRLRRGSL